MLLAMGTTYVLGRIDSTPGPPLPQMPDKVIVVKKVQEIKGDTIYLPGDPPPPKIVEKIKWKTKEVEVKVEVIKEVITRVYMRGSTGSLLAEVDIDAEKFEGLVGDSLEYGWAGRLRCNIRADSDEEWTSLVDEPFDLSSSYAISTLAPPEPHKRWTTDLRLGVVSTPGVDLAVSIHKRSRWGFYAGLQYDLDPETFESVFYDDDFLQTIKFEADRARVYGGFEFRIGRR